MTLSEYVLKRNGVPLGARGSLANNLGRALGAGSNADFWRHWNPVWGFYLARFIYLPLKSHIPRWLATIAAFAVSGALHDLAVGLLGIAWQSFFTSWFTVMGAFLVLSRSLQIDYSGLSFVLRVLLNIGSLIICYAITMQLREIVFSI
jgi:D-alanyl-lipoteichoic acid acyltransferase DltB (MBOAT superfamily)